MDEDGRLRRLGCAIADWGSFQMRTIEGWFDRSPETAEDRAIRLEGERIRKSSGNLCGLNLGLYLSDILRGLSARLDRLDLSQNGMLGVSR